MIQKIISGGQTGADRAALDFAIKHSLPYGRDRTVGGLMMNEANMCLEGPKGRLISFAVACQLALLITALTLQAGDTGIPGAHTITQTSSSSAIQPKGLVGKATYVAERYNGRRTSSGEIYDSRKLTAAHSTIPHGTRVKVLNLANNRSVVVTVNDRCRKRSFEFIDLSRAAARELGFLGKGRATVRIIPIDE